MNFPGDHVFNYPRDPLSTDASIALDRRLAPFLNDAKLDETSKLMEFLSGGVFRELLRRIVIAICSDPEKLLLCAQRSQSHPLGFSKILILSTQWYQIRLNFWSELGVRREREDIHDHRFDFASAILAGTLIAELYEIAEEGDPVFHFMDRLPADHGEPYVLEKIGQVHVRKAGVHRLAQGSAYVTRAESLHRIIAVDGAPVVTAFVKFAPTRRDANVLIAPAVAEGRGSQVRHFFTVETVNAVLQRILDLALK